MKNTNLLKSDNNAIDVFRLKYGADSLQFGDLIVPNKPGVHPVVMIIHGGCWRSKYSYTLMDEMARDLSNRGYATWNIEYRRTEDPGGGWPGTFTDVANALKFLEKIGSDYPIDLKNIVVIGHSAGGHLALMLGVQKSLHSQSAIKIQHLPKIKGIVSLAGITDLQSYLAPSGCGSNVLKLVGGKQSQYPNRYLEGSPINSLPLGIHQILITGEDDSIVSIDHIKPYFKKAKLEGDSIDLVLIPDAGHFEVITPGSIAWPTIVDALGGLFDK